MLAEGFDTLFTAPKVISLLVLSLLLTIYFERRRLRRWRRTWFDSASSELPREWEREFFFWLEVVGTFFVVALFCFLTAIGLYVLVVDGRTVFAGSKIGFAIGIIGFLSLLGILLLESE